MYMNDIEVYVLNVMYYCVFLYHIVSQLIANFFAPGSISLEKNIGYSKNQVLKY
jgi:hypothetical protein